MLTATNDHFGETADYSVATWPHSTENKDILVVQLLKLDKSYLTVNPSFNGVSAAI